MKIIRGGRRSGKTISALTWMLGDEKRLLIVPTATRPVVVRLLRDMIGKTDPRIEGRIFGAGEIANGDRIRGMAAGEIGIDELGWVLSEILKPSVTFATINDYHLPTTEGDDAAELRGRVAELERTNFALSEDSALVANENAELRAALKRIHTMFSSTIGDSLAESNRNLVLKVPYAMRIARQALEKTSDAALAASEGEGER